MIVNALLGWTVIGWAVALGWALAGESGYFGGDVDAGSWVGEVA